MRGGVRELGQRVHGDERVLDEILEDVDEEQRFPARVRGFTFDGAEGEAVEGVADRGEARVRVFAAQSEQYLGTGSARPDAFASELGELLAHAFDQAYARAGWSRAGSLFCGSGALPRYLQRCCRRRVEHHGLPFVGYQSAEAGAK